MNITTLKPNHERIAELEAEVKHLQHQMKCASGAVRAMLEAMFESAKLTESIVAEQATIAECLHKLASAGLKQ